MPSILYTRSESVTDDVEQVVLVVRAPLVLG